MLVESEPGRLLLLLIEAVIAEAELPIDANCSDKDGRVFGGSFEDLLKCNGLFGFTTTTGGGTSFAIIGSFLEYDGIGMLDDWIGVSTDETIAVTILLGFFLVTDTVLNFGLVPW